MGCGRPGGGVGHRPVAATIQPQLGQIEHEGDGQDERDQGDGIQDDDLTALVLQSPGPALHPVSRS
jgi:hypothetical protein